MPKLVIFYEPLRGKDYTRLTDELHTIGASRVFQSLWVVNHRVSPLDMANHLLGFVDSNDKLVVVEATGNIAWTENLSRSEVESIRSQMA